MAQAVWRFHWDRAIIEPYQRERARTNLGDEASMPSGWARPQYRLILAVDIEGFGGPARNDLVRVRRRSDLRFVLAAALARSGIPEDALLTQDTGDGLLMMIDPAVVNDHRLVDAVTTSLAHNLSSLAHYLPEDKRLRLRVVLHAGEVLFDHHGVVGDDVTLAFRLLDSDELRAALQLTDANLVVGLTEDIYGHVVARQLTDVVFPDDFRPVNVSAKETRARVWIYMPSIRRRGQLKSRPSAVKDRPLSRPDRMALTAIAAKGALGSGGSALRRRVWRGFAEGVGSVLGLAGSIPRRRMEPSTTARLREMYAALGPPPPAAGDPRDQGDGRGGI